MLAFKWSWAVPKRSADVLGGSRARIIDFSMVLGGLGWGESMGARGRAMLTTPAARPRSPARLPEPFETVVTGNGKLIEIHIINSIIPTGARPPALRAEAFENISVGTHIRESSGVSR